MADLELKVASVTDLTTAIRQFELISRGPPLPPFEAGAHIDIETGAEVIRSYSLANDPAQSGSYVIAVLREPDGRGSIWMHDDIQVGAMVRATGPNNNFPLAPDATSHLLIAGGIGITPLLSMGYVLAKGDKPFHLHYCTRSPVDTAYSEEVKAVFGKNLTFHHDGGDPANGIDLDTVLKSHGDGAHLYICGPGGLLSAARNSASHWPADTVHFELFSSARTEQEKAEIERLPNKPFEIELAQSGLTLTVPPDKTILDILQENGVDMVYVCEDGWCGTCEVAMLGGRADHRDEILDDDDKKANTKIQVCISRAMPGEKLILDL